MIPDPLKPTRRKIEIRGYAGRGILFCYLPDSNAVEIKDGDAVYTIPLWYLTEFSCTSQRSVFQAYPDESDL